MVNAGESSVQAHGCWALCALARRHRANARIMCQGLDHAVPQAIKYAIDSNSGDAALTEKGCAALRALCDDSEVNARVLLEEGVVKSICQVMKQNPEAAATLRQAIGVSVALSISIAARKEFRKHKLISLVTDALRVHIDSTGVVEQALAALCNTCMDAEGRVMVMSSGAMEQVRAVIEKHKYHPSIQMACCDLVANLSSTPENQPLMVSAGMMETTLEAIIITDHRMTLHASKPHHF